MTSETRDDWEQHWTSYADSAERNPSQAWRRSLVIAALHLQPGDRVIDIGSGQGDLAADLLASAPGVEVVGLELSASGVLASAAKAPTAAFHQVDLLGAQPNVPSLVGWATKLTCSEVLEHLDDPRAFLRNALLHARPGALVVVTVPAGPRTAFDRHIGHRQHYTRSALRDLLQDAGLDVLGVRAAGFPIFNLYRLIVFARGRRLIADATGGTGKGTERLARVVMAAFGKVLPFSTRNRFGWQLIAVARLPDG